MGIRPLWSVRKQLHGQDVLAFIEARLCGFDFLFSDTSPEPDCKVLKDFGMGNLMIDPRVVQEGRLVIGLVSRGTD